MQELSLEAYHPAPGSEGCRWAYFPPEAVEQEARPGAWRVVAQLEMAGLAARRKGHLECPVAVALMRPRTPDIKPR